MRTLTEQIDAVRRGDASPVDLVQRACDRADGVQSQFNAFTCVLRDRARHRAEQLHANPQPEAPLFGVPVAVKDLFDVSGAATTGCCAAYAGRVVPASSDVVDRLEAAGAIVIAKTNQHELACGTSSQVSCCGPVRNPWDVSRVPGGSSGGSAVAVAAGVTAVAMGSDTAGSIRIPASMCGVTGLKPTHGSVSMRGAMPLAPSLDTAGPLAATAQDCLLIHRVLRTAAGPPAPQSLAGLRVGLLDAFCEGADPGVGDATREAAKVLESAGLDIDIVDSLGFHEALDAFGLVIRAELAHAYRDLWDEPRVHPSVAALIDVGRKQAATDYLAGLDGMRAVRRRFLDALQDRDALIAPAASQAAPAARTPLTGGPPAAPHQSSIRMTAPANVAGLPALAVPAGFDGDLPVGVQLIGRPHSEELLCALGTKFQSVTDWHLRTPPC